MIKQKFNIKHYWKVIIYYDVNGDFLFPIFKDLKRIGFPTKDINEIFGKIKKNKIKGVTCSNGAKHISIIIFTKHKNIYDFINSLVHEAEHIKQAMLNTYMIEDKGEPPAYTIGYLLQRMWEVSKDII
jgi:hypothetical protein